MNTYIAIRPYIAQQVIELLKKLPYNEVSGIINEIGDSMNYPVQLNWNQPVGDGEGEEKKEEEEKKEKEEEEKEGEQRKPIGFRFVEEEVDGDDGGKPDDEPTIICKPKKQVKQTK